MSCEAPINDSRLVFSCMSGENYTWCYAYVANLCLTTPLSHLRAHGQTLTPSEAGQTPTPPDNPRGGRHGQWMMFLDESEAEDEVFSFDTLTHDLSECPVTTASNYHAFLLALRAIIEDHELLPSAKRQRLDELLASQRHPDVIHALGGAEKLIDDCLPHYLTHLQREGLSEATVDALAQAGITNRWALAQLDSDSLTAMTASGACKDHHRLTLEWHQCRHSLACLDGYAPQPRLALHDPVIQRLY